MFLLILIFQLVSSAILINCLNLNKAGILSVHNNQTCQAMGEFCRIFKAGLGVEGLILESSGFSSFKQIDPVCFMSYDTASVMHIVIIVLFLILRPADQIILDADLNYNKIALTSFSPNSTGSFKNLILENLILGFEKNVITNVTSGNLPYSWDRKVIFSDSKLEFYSNGDLLDLRQNCNETFLNRQSNVFERFGASLVFDRNMAYPVSNIQLDRFEVVLPGRARFEFDLTQYANLNEVNSTIQRLILTGSAILLYSSILHEAVFKQVMEVAISGSIREIESDVFKLFLSSPVYICRVPTQ
jgi:hypothetical protein